MLHEKGADVETFWDFLDLAGYAVRFRYETLPEDEEPLDRSALLEDVLELFNRVEALLSDK